MPFWQAVAADLLDPWVYDPEVANALLEKASHTNALVRGTVVQALDSLARRHDPRVEGVVSRLLKDPVRKVRVDAAWVLRDHLDLTSEAGQDLLRSLNYSLDMPTGALQKGIFHLDRGEPDKALEYIEWAIKLDSYSAQLRHEYAIVLSMAGRPQKAIEALQEAIRLAPKEAEFHYKLGLAWHEVNRPDQTVVAFQEAVRLEPRHARAWYNLGLMLNQLKRPDEAIEALQNAERAEPNDPQIPFALATVLERVGRRGEAVEAARRALRIQPNYREAQAFLQQVGN
jgi:tetratricopeptide (TPR) repeat protein